MMMTFDQIASVGLSIEHDTYRVPDRIERRPGYIDPMSLPFCQALSGPLPDFTLRSFGHRVPHVSLPSHPGGLKRKGQLRVRVGERLGQGAIWNVYSVNISQDDDDEEEKRVQTRRPLVARVSCPDLYPAEANRREWSQILVREAICTELRAFIALRDLQGKVVPVLKGTWAGIWPRSDDPWRKERDRSVWLMLMEKVSEIVELDRWDDRERYVHLALLVHRSVSPPSRPCLPRPHSLRPSAIYSPPLHPTPLPHLTCLHRQPEEPTLSDDRSFPSSATLSTDSFPRPPFLLAPNVSRCLRS